MVKTVYKYWFNSMWCTALGLELEPVMNKTLRDATLGFEISKMT